MAEVADVVAGRGWRVLEGQTDVSPNDSAIPGVPGSCDDSLSTRRDYEGGKRMGNRFGVFRWEIWDVGGVAERRDEAIT